MYVYIYIYTHIQETSKQIRIGQTTYKKITRTYKQQTKTNFERLGAPCPALGGLGGGLPVAHHLAFLPPHGGAQHAGAPPPPPGAHVRHRSFTHEYIHIYIYIYIYREREI